MKFIKKLKARRKGEILMTPLPKKESIQSFVPFKGKKDDTKPILGGRNVFLEPIKESDQTDEDVSYSPELIKAYQEEYPTKHAIWRGKHTKQFIKWAENANKV